MTGKASSRGGDPQALKPNEAIATVGVYIEVSVIPKRYQVLDSNSKFGELQVIKVATNSTVLTDDVEQSPYFLRVVRKMGANFRREGDGCPSRDELTDSNDRFTGGGHALKEPKGAA